MLTNRIAAGAAVILLGISGVALANVDIATETQSEVQTPAASADVAAQTETSASASLPATPVTVDHTSSTVSASVEVEGDAEVDASTSTTHHTTSTTIQGSTSTTIDDRPGGDDSDEQEARSLVSLGLTTYTVGEAGTVSVDGMTLVAVTTNLGWTVEIDEVSSERIRIEFEKGELNARFELRSDGELRIRIGS
jgi:cytoskeletal protein RodZ